MCPQSHPVALISIGSEFGFDITGITDPKSLVFSNGDTTGFGFHGDYLQGWMNSTALQESFSNCFDNNNCPWDAFDAPGGVAVNPTPRTPQAIVQGPLAENLGLNGPISALPGNNPVYTPGGCVATSSATVVATTLATLKTSPTTVVIQVPSTSSVSVQYQTVTVTVTASAAVVQGTCPAGCVQAPLG